MLNLKKIEYKSPFVVLDYTVQHHVGPLPTVLEQDLQLRVHAETGSVQGELVFSELTASSVDEARQKLAGWCERMAAALRSAALRETPSVELPLYTRAPFSKETLFPYQRELYATLVERLSRLPEEEEAAFIKQCAAEHHPLILIPGVVAPLCQEAADRRKAQLDAEPMLASRDYATTEGTLEVMSHREESLYFDPPDGTSFAISDPADARRIAAQLLAWADQKEPKS